MRLALEFGTACRSTRIRLDLTQRQLADSLGVSRTFIARLEAGKTPVSLDMVDRIGWALGLRLALSITPPVFLAERKRHDLVHARCVSYVARRLASAGWLVAREVHVSAGAIHGWIDLIAFDPRSRTLLVIEVKTSLADLGGLERQVQWYERHAAQAARSRRWSPSRVATWVLLLASAEVEAELHVHRSLFDREFKSRAPEMLNGEPRGRGLALIDPVSRRKAWLIRTRLDGRRSAPPYRDYADAARRLSR